jgi:hypothetical protein
MSDDNDRLFDRVLFESDRTCCICRDRARPVKVHHIDGNHSNNERSNLVVLCDPCHTLAHTNIPFSRNLTPEQVRLYDETWRAMCAARLLPGAVDRDNEEYRQEVLLELSFACHDWKNHYIQLQSRDLQNVTGNFKDVWDLLIEVGCHEASADEWNNYRPLFDESINRVIDNLRSILACHGDVIPASIKTLVIRTTRQLSVERTVYHIFGPARTSVKMRSQEVLRSLAALARAADAGTKASPVVPFRE